MIEYGLPALYAMFLWWFSTGALLWLDRLHPRTFPWSMGAASLLAAAALWGLAHTRADTSLAGAYVAFTCAVLVWGWQEMAFLLGYVTGPRRHACHSGCSGLRHFRHGVLAVLYHELALVVTGAFVLHLVWDAPNAVGAWTFIALWAMRQSAKLNLFLGVRNVGDEFMPPHLEYLKSYFRRKPMNLLFPLSVTASTAAATFLALQLTGGVDPARQAGLLLVVTLLCLGILEHWFMVLPIPVDAMWRWSLGGAAHRTGVSPPIDDDPGVRKQLQSV
jgi:putative photosynthetic complex assembly protein 2